MAIADLGCNGACLQRTAIEESGEEMEQGRREGREDEQKEIGGDDYRQVCGAGSMKRCGVRPPVLPSVCPSRQTAAGRFAAVGAAVRRY